MPTIALYPFRFYDLVTRKWWRARYVCELPQIAERYAAFQIIGRPELREVPDKPELGLFPPAPG